ncbi:NAD dependent epimerase/dehydratase family protein [compost metagenome]
MTSNLKIAILGATGHIAKNIIRGFSEKGEYELFLFARNTESVEKFVTLHTQTNVSIHIYDISHFTNFSYDVIINCIGIGDPAKLRNIGGTLFILTEKFDNLILDHLTNNTPDALYVNLSSGVAYGSNFSLPADSNKASIIDINSISSTDYYTISKINTEAKHRAYSNLNIVDLRVFGFFSRFIDLKTPYFMSDLVNCILQKREFLTGNNDMVRDYVHPIDLIHLIEHCIRAKKINDVFDVYSLEPISKFKLIDYFIQNYDLRVNISNENILTSPTGIKSNYYSQNKRAESIGYKPLYRSIDSLTSELDAILRV